MTISKKFLETEYMKCLTLIDEMIEYSGGCQDTGRMRMRTGLVKLKLSALQDKNLEKIRKSIQRIEVKLK